MKIRPSSIIQSVLIAVVIICAAALSGCAKIQPGADPVVVNTERFLSSAQGTFLFTLQVDNADRGFWKVKAPAFHEYCETLRRPTPYPFNSTNYLPQYRVALLGLNDLKNDYKAGRASSNALLTALSTLQGLQQQAVAWLTITTNRNSLTP